MSETRTAWILTCPVCHGVEVFTDWTGRPRCSVEHPEVFEQTEREGRPFPRPVPARWLLVPDPEALRARIAQALYDENIETETFSFDSVVDRMMLADLVTGVVFRGY